MACESTGLSGGFEGIFFDENLIIKKEEMTDESLEDTRDNEIPCEDELADHKKVQTLERAFKCDLCPRSFEFASGLALHKKSHNNIRPKTYTCGICEKSFSTSSNLSKHRMIHTGEKPYECDHCKKSFRESSLLAVHKRIHTGEKPYQCDICNKSFCESSTLTVHKRMHTGERPYQCDQCGKCFATSSALTSHKRIHTGEKRYQCDQCDKAFTFVGNLLQHKRIHTKEKPYQCDQCNQSFRFSSKLTAHKRSHTGEKRYQCDSAKTPFISEESQEGESDVNSWFRCMLCDEKFNTKMERRNHLLLHGDSCKCELSESELQEICVGKPPKCTKCEKYISLESPYEAVNQPSEGSSTDGLEPLQNTDEALNSKKDQSTWMSSELEAPDDVEAVGSVL